MMRSTTTLCFIFFCLTLFAQRKPIKIDTWEGESFYTSDYQFENQNGSISILVEGRRLTMKNIKRYQKDTLIYRFENPGKRYKIFQRTEDNPGIDVYSTNKMVPFVINSKQLVKKSSDRYEAGEGGPLKRFNYKNLSVDLALDPEAMSILGEARKLQTWERLSYIIPIGLTYLAASQLPSLLEEEAELEGIVLTAVSIASFTIPLYINGKKDEKYREAVRIYDGQ